MYKSLIIGAGQIAGGYDNPSDTAVLTHAHAYQNDKNIELLGFYDTNPDNAQKMGTKWGVKTFKTLEEVKDVDIISICSPDFCHLESVKEALKLNPKVIFLEKPLSDNLEEAQRILEISKNVPILVNYSRRFIKEFQDLTKRIKSNEFGDFKTGNGYYGKGFVHNGSHMLDLLNLFLGDIEKVTVINEIMDYTKNDPTKTAVIEFKNSGTFFMQGCDCNNFTIFELDMIFEKARIKVSNLGNNLEIYKIKESNQYKGYSILELSENYTTEINFAMANAVSNIVSFLSKYEPLISTVQNAFEVIRWLK